MEIHKEKKFLECFQENLEALEVMVEIFLILTEDDQHSVILKSKMIIVNLN